MKYVTGLMALIWIVAGMHSPCFAEAQPSRAKSRAVDVSKDNVKINAVKGATVVTQPFRVQSVQFQQVQHAGQTRLAVAVVFNKEIDPTSVQQNQNIRLLRKNDQHFWVDAATQGNVVNVRPTFITWLSGAQLETGVYIMHLRGTLKSKDGLYLDCNGDGQGEGGYLPAYESQMYNAVVQTLETIENTESLDRIKKTIGTDNTP
jgi:hypothetical protein